MDGLHRLEGTAACDEKGYPLVLHHGTYETFDRFGVDDGMGFHFGTIDQAERRERDKRKTRAGRDWRIMSVALDVRRPLVLPDDPRHWDTWHTVVTLCRLADPAFLDVMKEDGVLTAADATARMRRRLVDLGYDSIVYRNLFEGQGRGAADWSWLVFSPDAVVMLPDGMDGVLEDVGPRPPLHPLPRSAKEIPGARSRNCSVRYTAHRMEFLSAVKDVVEGLGGTVHGPRHGWDKPHEGWYDFDVEIGGYRMKGDIGVENGRVVLQLGELPREVIDHLADDWAAWGGFTDVPRRNSMAFTWVAGETVSRFAGRLSDRLGLVREAAAASWDMLPSPC